MEWPLRPTDLEADRAPRAQGRYLVNPSQSVRPWDFGLVGPSLKARVKAGAIRLVREMKFPKEIRRNCPWCGKHTIHSVALYKRGKERAGSWGARRQAGRKRGYGGQKFPELIRTAKTTKKATLRLKCKECNREMMTYGIRLRKAEIAA